ncbi:MAG: DUF3298 domain-containing protein [Candidatus Eisenbacteria bacterium]
MNRWKRAPFAPWIPLLLLAGCGGGGKSDAPPAVTWEMVSNSWEDETCAEGGPCTRVSLSYPVFAPGDVGVAEEINGYVRGELLRSVSRHGSAPSPADLAAAFIADYREFKARFPESAQVWTMSRSVELLPAPEGVISLRSVTEVYSGGAHGNETANLASFDGKEGRRLSLADLLEQGKSEELDALAERRFREARGIGRGEDLSAAGFAFEGGRFRPGTNFAAVEEGLLFHFDPYEVGSYAAGPTDFLLSWDDLGKILKREWAPRVR